MQDMTVIQELARQFPQLYLKPEAGLSQSDLYRAIVRKGQRYQGELGHFTGSAEDGLTVEQTPAGDASVVFFKNRADFECFYRIMACRGEPVEVPLTMGSCYISGINDWSRIHAHMDAYRAAGGEDPKGEFARFTADSANYKAALVLLADGPYSAVPAKQTPYTEKEWLDISREIRKYHELTHFVCRKKYPEKKQPVWDELLADCMGLVFAVGSYDLPLARAFLGIKDGQYVGGRLENYLDTPPDAEMVKRVNEAMENLSFHCGKARAKGVEGYELMMLLATQAEDICGNLFPLCNRNDTLKG